MRFQMILLSISMLLIFTALSNAQDTSDNRNRKLPSQFDHSDENTKNNQSGDTKLPSQFNHTDENPANHETKDPFERYSGSGTYYFTFLSDTYIAGSAEGTKLDGNKYYYYYWSGYSVSYSEAENAAALACTEKGYSSYYFNEFIKSN